MAGTNESPKTLKLARHDLNMLKGVLAGSGCREYLDVFVGAGLKSVAAALEFRDGFYDDSADDKDYKELIAYLTPEGASTQVIAGATANERLAEMKRIVEVLRDRADHVAQQRVQLSMTLYADDDSSDSAAKDKKKKRKKRRKDSSSESDSDSDDSVDYRRRRKASKEAAARRQEEKDTRKMHDVLETLPCGAMAPERTPSAGGRRAVTEAFEASKPGLPELNKTDWGYADFELPTSNDRATAHAKVLCVCETLELGTAVDLSKKAYKHVKTQPCDRVTGVGNARGEEIENVGIAPGRLRTLYTMYTRAADKAELSRDEAWEFFGNIYSSVSVTMRRETCTLTRALDEAIKDSGLFNPAKRPAPLQVESGSSSTQRVKLSSKNIPCRDFAKGKCNYGDSCRFAHVAPSPSRGRSESKGRESGERSPSAGRTPHPKSGSGKGKAVKWQK